MLLEDKSKAPCSVVKKPSVPAIRPVDPPRIRALLDGQIFVGEDTPRPM